MEIFIGIIATFTVINFIGFLALFLAVGTTIKKTREIKPILEQLEGAANAYRKAITETREIMTHMNLPEISDKLSIFEKRLDQIQKDQDLMTQ